jgi:hypothetical protein
LIVLELGLSFCARLFLDCFEREPVKAPLACRDVLAGSVLGDITSEYGLA